MKVHGKLARPVVAMVGEWPEDEVEAVRAMVGTVDVNYGLGSEKLIPSEVDFVCIAGEVQIHPDYLKRHLLWVEGSGQQVPWSNPIGQVGFGKWAWVSAGTPSRSHESNLVPCADPTLGGLVSAWAGSLTTLKGMVTLGLVNSGANGWVSAVEDPIWPTMSLLAEREQGRSLAVAGMRPLGSYLCWIPAPVPNRLDWVRAVLAILAETDREAFAAVVPWREQPRWMTPEELRLRSELSAVREERDRLTRELDSREGQLREQLARAQDREDHGLRALLTTQDTALVSAVSSALAAMGFLVEDRDAALPPGAPKGEDLRLRDPDEPDWRALVEVKGYRDGGAKSKDIVQIERHAGRFERELGYPPSSKIYVINGQFSRAPDARQRPFAGDPDTGRDFGDDDGLVLATTDLFLLTRAVIAGELQPAHARERLRRARGVFELVAG